MKQLRHVAMGVYIAATVVACSDTGLPAPTQPGYTPVTPQPASLVGQTYVFKFNTKSGWKCLSDVGDSIQDDAFTVGGSDQGFTYRLGGTNGHSTDSTFLKTDSTGSSTEQQKFAWFAGSTSGRYYAFGVSATFVGSTYSLVTGLSRIKFDSISHIGWNWFTVGSPSSSIEYAKPGVAIHADGNGNVLFADPGTAPACP